ncbi:TPA: SDR family oxidoreductase [Vibrio vulnificus]|nr:SDR family oxidoreductase [Vibrio vulnificus]
MSELYLVTGASSGIGLAICRSLLVEGHRVIGVSRSLKEGIAALQTDYPDAFQFCSRDLSETIDELPKWMLTLSKQYGRFSGIVHAAGMLDIVPNRFNTHDSMLRTFNLNLFSGLAIARGFSDKRVHSQQGGSIVFIASIAASVGAAGTVNYGASKASLIGATKSLAKELATKSIRVNTVSPGLIRTELSQSHHESDFFERLNGVYPLGLGQPQYVADAVTFLLSEKAQWITGTDLVVDGGITLGTNE